jgi:hypothetical protein
MAYHLRLRTTSNLAWRSRSRTPWQMAAPNATRHKPTTRTTIRREYMVRVERWPLLSRVSLYHKDADSSAMHAGVWDPDDEKERADALRRLLEPKPPAFGDAKHVRTNSAVSVRAMLYPFVCTMISTKHCARAATHTCMPRSTVVRLAFDSRLTGTWQCTHQSNLIPRWPRKLGPGPLF